MPKITYTQRLLFASLSLSFMASVLSAQDASATSGDNSKKKTDDSIVVMDKLSADQGLDTSGVLPPSNNIFGLSKSALETPRSVSMISGDMVENFNIGSLADLERFSPSTYTAFSFGVQGALSVRGDSADMFYGDMKKINNAANVPTIIGATDGVLIVRGPPSAVYGAGVVGGYMSYTPKSARASTGKYLPKLTGKSTITVDNWGKKIGTLEVGGPLTIFGKKAGFYAFTQQEDSKTYYIGQRIGDQIYQGTLTVDLTPDLRLETGGNYQLHHGTGIAGWNRVTQQLVDNGTYQAGTENFSLIDTNNDGIASRQELYNAGLAGNYNFTASGTPVANQVKPGTTAYTNPAGPLALVNNVHTTTLDPRNVLLERINWGEDYIWFADITNDSNPDLVFKDKSFYEQQAYHKLSDIAYDRWGDSNSFENRVTVEWHPQHLPDWLEASLVGAGNIRYLDTTIATTNVFQLFNYWDLTQYKNGQYLFANGWDNSTLNATGAGEDSHSKSQTLETGLGTLADLTAFKKLSLTVGARHDWINADLQNYPGLSTNGSTVMNAVAASHYKISQDRSSLTSASLSYKVLPNISPYITYATPRNIVPGQTGGLATAQLKGQVLTASKLREAGIKGEFFHKRLYVSFATYEQNRTVFNQSLNNNVGDFQQTRSDGQELEARWVPTKNFNMSAAMNWQQAYTVPLAPGFTPVPVTSTPLNPINFGGGRYQKAYSVNRTRKALPGQVFSVFGDYIFGNSGFDWSAGVNYTAGYYASTIQDIKLPSSLTVSTDVGYKTKKWEARLSVTNLTDTLFFTSTSGSAALIPQPGRTYTAKFTYKF